MKALPLMVEKLWHIFKICRSKVTVKVTRSKFWYEWQGLIIRMVHAKYESSTFNGSKVMGKVKVFVTDRRTDGRTDRRMRFNVPRFRESEGQQGATPHENVDKPL